MIKKRDKIKLSEIKPGDTLYLVDYTLNQDGYRKVVVEKVGRKYVKMQGLWTKFEAGESNYLKGDNWYGRFERAFRTEDAAKEYLQKRVLAERLCRAYIRWERLSLSQLRGVVKILKEGDAIE